MRRMMEDRFNVRLFKMQLVLPLVSLSPKERARSIHALTKKAMEIPFSNRKTLSRSTIYKWLKEFQDCSDHDSLFLGKERSDKGCFPSLTPKQKNALLVWRNENTYRTVEQLREELLSHEETNTPSVPSISTIRRFLRSSGYDRQSMIRRWGKWKARLPFNAEYPQQLWQMDTKGHYVKIQDPDNPENQVDAKLIVIIDDCSRFCVGAKYVIQENQDAVISLFRTAISLYGIPEILYTDQGSPYVGHKLKKAATLLGCRVRSTPAADPQAKGKIEKIMPNFTNKLESEMKLVVTSLTQKKANEYVQAHIGQDYNRRIHGATGKVPEEHFFSLPAKYRRFVSEKTLSYVFLDNKMAKVSQDGRIRFRNQQYLVPHMDLYGKKIILRYQEEDLARIFVWCNDRYYGEAYIYIPENDFNKRVALEKALGEQTTPVPLPSTEGVPEYSRLQRMLASHRKELEDRKGNTEDLVTHELEVLRERRGEMKKVGEQAPPFHQEIEYDESSSHSFIFLFSLLFRRQLSPSERRLLDTFWRHSGPFSEIVTRKAIGELLGKNHPTDDLRKYLETIRSLSQRED